MIDSDNYFTKNFNPEILFENNTLKTFAWKPPEDVIQKDRNFMLWCCNKPILRNHKVISAYDMRLFIKEFFGNKNKEFYGFVISPQLFNSDALARMKEFIDKKGGYKISTIIRLIPFEMQWYGEYILQHEKFIKSDGIMTLISSPDECHPEDGGPNAYGLWFQSVIYDYENYESAPVKDNDNLIYKRPAHCK